MHLGIGKETGRQRYQRTNGDLPDYNITMIDQNTKNPGDLMRLAVTLTPVKSHQLTFVRKTLKIVK